MIELSNYWDDFAIRVNTTIESLENGKSVPLERLTVHLTERCNFRCEYCNMKDFTRTMDKSLAKKIIDDYAAINGRIIHFTGGEPSVVYYLEEIFEYAKSKGLQVSTNTNAFKKISTKNVDKLKTSFDTPYGDIFDETVNANAFTQVVQNMKAYSEEMQGKMLSITAVLNRKTYKHMLDLAKFVHENFKVYNLYYSNYKGSNPKFAFTTEEIEDMFSNYIPETLKYFKETNNNYSYNQLSLYEKSDFANTDCRFVDNLYTPCYIQLSEMTIDIDGYCYDCSHLFRDGVKPDKMVNVRDNTLLECFTERKQLLKNYTCINKKCLNGCNKNLIGFNKAVHKKQKL